MARIPTSVFQCSASTSAGLPALLSMSWFNLYRVLMSTFVIIGRIHFSHTLSQCPHISQSACRTHTSMPSHSLHKRPTLGAHTTPTLERVQTSMSPQERKLISSTSLWTSIAIVERFSTHVHKNARTSCSASTHRLSA